MIPLDPLLRNEVGVIFKQCAAGAVLGVAGRRRGSTKAKNLTEMRASTPFGQAFCLSPVDMSTGRRPMAALPRRTINKNVSYSVSCTVAERGLFPVAHEKRFVVPDTRQLSSGLQRSKHGRNQAAQYERNEETHPQAQGTAAERRQPGGLALRGKVGKTRSGKARFSPAVFPAFHRALGRLTIAFPKLQRHIV